MQNSRRRKERFDNHENGSNTQSAWLFARCAAHAKSKKYSTLRCGNRFCFRAVSSSLRLRKRNMAEIGIAEQTPAEEGERMFSKACMAIAAMLMSAAIAHAD